MIRLRSSNMADYESVSGVRDDGSKIEVTNAKDMGDSSPTGKELMSKNMGSTPDAPVSSSKYGDPNAGLHGGQSGMMALQHLAAGKIDNRFYGHYLPNHFKKTSHISTTGR